ncbi:MAG TPA: hypothetical protein VN645_09585 [Steroidobacteraceae bacterium]|nr:hypothetical protein [Steroidobacteraceae bacterium]
MVRPGPHPANDSGFQRGHQVSRVLAVAVPLAMFLVWWGIWGTGEVKSVSETTAVVTQVDRRTCLVRIATGEQVRIIKERDLREGMTVRMRRTDYTRGKPRFELITAPLSTTP